MRGDVQWLQSHVLRVSSECTDDVSDNAGRFDQFLQDV